jgi:hypothetical protein
MGNNENSNSELKDQLEYSRLKADQDRLQAELNRISIELKRVRKRLSQLNGGGFFSKLFNSFFWATTLIFLLAG